MDDCQVFVISTAKWRSSRCDCSEIENEFPHVDVDVLPRTRTHKHEEHIPDSDAFTVTRETIIKFVRLTPTLRRLRSDLMAENVAVLKDERPEVAFVSD